jgi:hypothetical protein
LPDASEAFADNCALVTQNGEWVIAPVPFATKEDTYTLTVRCEFLTERVTTLESSAGDIDAALDGIIAIQESLITGGTDLTMAEEEGF